MTHFYPLVPLSLAAQSLQQLCKNEVLVSAQALANVSSAQVLVQVREKEVVSAGALAKVSSV